jgi:hypothetical protein
MGNKAPPNSGQTHCHTPSVRNPLRLQSKCQLGAGVQSVAERFPGMPGALGSTLSTTRQGGCQLGRRSFGPKEPLPHGVNHRTGYRACRVSLQHGSWSDPGESNGEPTGTPQASLINHTCFYDILWVPQGSPILCGRGAHRA